MSTTIDQRVVEMRFDNQNFEKNVSTTMSTLDKLKQRLNLTGASKGLEEVNSAAKRIDISGLGRGVEVVSSKFSALEVMGVTALANITNSAVNAGKRIASALTIEPIKTGFSEYETQINSVQTILANTSHAGTDINDVNKALDELNLYADKTIYNFTEMTRNIGTFTAAGLGLEESTAAIKGIANLAAVSGSTSTQASTAMYQLSQALANGTVNLQDWNSVVNAGMGGKVFQDALVRTASAMAGVTEETFRAENITGSFRESISAKGGKSWLTAEVLSKTLQQFTGDMTEAELRAEGFSDAQIKNIQAMGVTANDAATKVKTMTQLWDTLKESAQSGWSQTWKTVVGDFEESKELWTAVSDTIGNMIGSSAESRNNLLSGALDTNWEKMIKKINEAGIESSTFEEKIRTVAENHNINLDKMIEEHGSLEKAFRSGAISSDILTEAVGSLSKGLVDLSGIDRELKKGLKGDDVKTAQEALKNLGHDIGKTGADGIFGSKTEEAVKAFQELKGLEVTGIIDDKTLEALKEANKSTVDLTESCKGFISAITELGGREKVIAALKDGFNGVMNIIKPIKEAFREIFPPVTVEQVGNFIDKFRDLMANFAEFTSNHAPQIKSTFKGIFSVLDIGVTFIKDIAGGFVSLLGKFSGFSGGVLDVTASLGDWLSNLRDSVKESDMFGKAIDKVVEILGKIIGKFKEYKRSVTESLDSPEFEDFLGFFKALWNVVRKVGTAIGDVFASLGVKLSRVFNGDFDIFNAINSGLFAGILTGIARFTNKLPGLLDGPGDFFEGIKDTLDEVRGCFEAYQTQLKAGALMKIASAIAILAASIVVISLIDAEDLDRSIGAITIMFGELLGALAIFTKISSNLKGGLKAIPLMISMTTSILILSAALKVMSTMNLKQMGVALLGLTVSMGVMLAAVNLLPDKKVKNAANSIRTLSIAMLILSAALKVMGSMSWSELAKGLVGIAGGLAVMVAAIRLLPKDVGLRTLGIMGFATSMIIVGAAMKLMATMSWDEIGRSLAALAGSMISMAIALRMMPKNMIAIGIGILGVSASLLIIGAALKNMGGMQWDEIGRGLVAMGGSLVILAAGLHLMNGTIAGSAAMIIAAGALAIMAPVLQSLSGMTWGEIGKGLITVAGAFAIIGAAGYLLGPVVPAILGIAGAIALFGIGALAFGIGVAAIAAGFTALSVAGTAGATAFVASLAVIVTGIIGLIPEIMRGLGEIIVAGCDVLIQCAPKIAETILIVVSEVLAALATYTPQIVTSLMEFLIGVLDALAANLPQLIVSAVNLIGAFFQGIVQALQGMDTTAIIQGLIGVGILAGLMVALNAVVGLIPGAMIAIVGMGLVVAELALVIAAIGALAQIPGLNWLVEEGGNFLEKVGTAIGQFAGGIIGGFMGGVSSTFPQIGSDLSAFMANVQPFIDGARNIDASVMDGVKALAETILLLTAADILQGLTSWITGGSSLSSFGSELGSLGLSLNTFATNLGTFDESKVATITCAANAVKALSEAANSLPNEGGWAAKIFGENSISAFGAQLPLLASNLNAFATNLGTFDDSKVSTVTCAANAIKAIAQAAESIPNEGGWAAKIFGENSISTFGSQLPALGTSLSAFATNLGTFGDDKVATITCAGNAIKALSAAASGIDGQAEWAKKIFGDNGLAAFSSQFGTLGTNLSAFATNLGTFGEDKVITVNCAVRAIKAFAALADADLKGAKKNLDDFGGKLGTFATDISTFCTNMPASETIDAAVSGMKQIISMISDIASVESGATAEFTNALKNLGADGVKSFTTAFSNDSAKASVNNAIKGLINSAINSVKNAQTNLSNSGANLVESLNKGVVNKKSAVINTMTKLINDMVNAVTSKASAFNKAGTTLMTQFVSGISKKSKAPATAMTTAISGALTSISGYYDSFYSVGASLVDGFAAGISANSYKAAAKAAAMAAAAEKAAKEELDINSPSKIFRAIGYSVPEGFAMGIDKLASMAVNSASSMANSTFDAVNNAMSAIAVAMNSEVELQPMVRPVVDLSNVRAGAGAISGLLGIGTSVGVTSNLGAISTMMNANQNGGNDDVVSAIDKLRKDLSGIGGNTYTINGLNYGNDAALEEAFETILRHAQIERRM